MATLLDRCIAWQSVWLGSTALVMCGWYLCSRAPMRTQDPPHQPRARSMRARAQTLQPCATSMCAHELNHISLAREGAGIHARRGAREKPDISLAQERAEPRGIPARAMLALALAPIFQACARVGATTVCQRAPMHARALAPFFRFYF